MPSSTVREYAQALKRGEIVDVDELRAHFTTAACLRTKTAAVRRMYDGDLDEDGECTAQQMRDASQTESERACVEALINSYGRTAWEDTGNEHLDKLARSNGHVLLPKHVRAVCISADEARTCENESRVRLTQRHAAAVVVDGDELLATARNCIRRANAGEKVGLYELALALLAVTGRRTAEIMNGRSAFTHTGDDYRVLFSGQLKRRIRVSGETDCPPYHIPVLESAENVHNALTRLRSLQPSDIATSLTNEEVSKRYQKGISVKMHAEYGQCFTGRYSVHTLRAVYAGLVHRCFDCPPELTPIAIASRACGHKNVESALPYMAVHVRVSTANTASMGTLPTASEWLMDQHAD